MGSLKALATHVIAINHQILWYTYTYRGREAGTSVYQSLKRETENEDPKMNICLLHFEAVNREKHCIAACQILIYGRSMKTLLTPTPCPFSFQSSSSQNIYHSHCRIRFIKNNTTYNRIPFPLPLYNFASADINNRSVHYFGDHVYEEKKSSDSTFANENGSHAGPIIMVLANLLFNSFTACSV